MTQNVVSKSVSSLGSVQIVHKMDILRYFGIEHYAGKVDLIQNVFIFIAGFLLNFLLLLC